MKQKKVLKKLIKHFMETKQEFENLVQLNKYEKQNRGKLKLSDVWFSEKIKLWIAIFVVL
jgi:hypothetical protein